MIVSEFKQKIRPIHEFLQNELEQTILLL